MGIKFALMAIWEMWDIPALDGKGTLEVGLDLRQKA